MRILTLALFLTGLLNGQAKKYEIQKPSGKWQTPGEIQKVTAPIQKPGEIQVPKGIQAIKAQSTKCEQRLVIGADALFEFDKSTLTKDAEETLLALGQMLKEQSGKHPIVVEGHTDGMGTDGYNQQLSEKRAAAVQQWLVSRSYIEAQVVSVKGFGKKRPVAANAKPDGTDDPEGRQKNRRVEVVINTCQ